VLEVIGFQFKGERVMKTAAAMDDLENTDKQIKIVGQILCLRILGLEQALYALGH
jgi:hypothetical protein